jgi:glycosyltransferase involved in cell wall biosynthesis
VSGRTILRLYHSAVVGEYRERERWLRAKHGWDVHVVAPPSWPEGGSVVSAERRDDVPMHVVPVRGRRHPILFWYSVGPLRRILREVRPALVDLHEEPYSLAAWFALRTIESTAPGTPVCVYTAQNIFKRYPLPFRRLERRVLERAQAAFPCSTEAGAVLRRKGFGGRIHVIPLGVSPVRAEPAANGRLRVGFVGRLVPAKGAHVALEAYARASDGLGARFEVVGTGTHEGELRSLAARLGIADRVEFTGFVAQQEALARIASFDVLVVPSLSTASWKEQFGRVAAQALAAGTPVLASASGSLAEVVGDAGVLAREGDVDDWAEKLRALLRDDSRRAELALRGRRRAAAHFSWERVADRVDAMYREVLASA